MLSNSFFCRRGQKLWHRLGSWTNFYIEVVLWYLLLEWNLHTMYHVIKFNAIKFNVKQHSILIILQQKCLSPLRIYLLFWNKCSRSRNYLHCNMSLYNITYGPYQLKRNADLPVFNIIQQRKWKKLCSKGLKIEFPICQHELTFSFFVLY